MSDHDRYERLAATALDFPLSDAEAGALRTHLIGCSSCASFAAGIRSDSELASTRLRADAPSQVRTAVVAAAVSGMSVRRSRLALQAAGAFAVVLAVAVALATFGPLAQEPAHRGYSAFSLLPATPFRAGSLADVTTVGSKLIAVGTIQETGPTVGAVLPGSTLGAVWTSVDGQTWVLVSPTEPFIGRTLQRVASDGSTIVVLAQDSVWRSTDQHVWEAVSGPFAICCGAGNGVGFNAITWGPGGFTLVGTTFRLDPSGGSVVGAGVATSGDGRTWEFAPATDPALANGGMGGVAAGPAGLVAIGVVKPSGTPVTEPAPATLAAWVSLDGRTWTRTLLDGFSTTADIRDVAANGTEYVAVGRDGHSAAAWVSNDGRTWRAARDSAELDNATMSRVIALGGAFVAIGQTTGGDGVAWISVDGQSWTILDTGSIFAGAPISAAGVIGSRLLLFGTDERGEIVGAISAGH